MPVAHSTKQPRRNPRPSNIRSPCPFATMMEKVANALACGASRSIVPLASSIEVDVTSLHR